MFSNEPVAPVYICTPVFNRYDLLREMLFSLRESTLMPAAVYIVNEGLDVAAAMRAVEGVTWVTVYVFTPAQTLGASACGNWFIKNVPNDRLHCNDDIKFHPETIERMARTPGDVVAAAALGWSAGFACCIIRQSCVDAVGLFDETLSPGYIYFDDCDYGYRMELAGMCITGVDCTVSHGHSQSIKAKTPEQMNEHFHRFTIAQNNFVKKWGGLPGHETTPPRSSLASISKVVHPPVNFPPLAAPAAIAPVVKTGVHVVEFEHPLAQVLTDRCPVERAAIEDAGLVVLFAENLVATKQAIEQAISRGQNYVLIMLPVAGMDSKDWLMLWQMAEAVWSATDLTIALCADFRQWPDDWFVPMFQAPTDPDESVDWPSIAAEFWQMALGLEVEVVAEVAQ